VAFWGQMRNSVQCYDGLSPEQQEQIQQVLSSLEDSDGLDSNGHLRVTPLVEHRIDTGNAQPVKQRYYPVSPPIQKIINEELDRMLKLGIVEESRSPWSSPILVVKKPNGTYRLCLDSRKLNSLTVKDSYPLPYVSATLDKLRNAKVISSIDLRSAFWQIPLEESSKEKCAFTVPGRGLFHFIRLPYGLHNSSASFQRLMDRIIGPDLEPNVLVYLDDTVIVTEDFESHIRLLNLVIQRIKEAGLTVNADKCEICKPELKYLGYLIDHRGLRADPDKVKSIVSFPAPKNVKEVRQFIGMASWYRRFIPSFSDKTSPLTELTKKKKKWEWTEECAMAFVS